MTDQQGSGATDPVMNIATGFMASKYLFVAVELGLFEHLLGKPLDLEALAARTGAPARTVRVVADALVGLGLLTRGPEGYGNTPAAQAHLARSGPGDLRPVLRLFDRISYRDWAELGRAVRTGEPTRATLTSEDQSVLSEGVEALTGPAAAALATAYDFASHRRLLDLGGGTGSFLSAVLRRHPHLSGTLIDMPGVAALARDRLARAGLSARASVVAGDILTGDLPAGHDAVLIANVLHLMGPARNRQLLRRVRRSVGEEARLLLVDFFTDPTHTQPALATLLAGTFLTGYGEGDVYSENEVTEWLADTGWRKVAIEMLAGPARLIVATTV